ncbi:hypothetical protein FOMPIDRAFT_1052000 [Fomitopsis schrenkii]|uniref:Uncharacterized protein n=1 Tax=Fomitopsis schrenkii TaxID=2126942 RepID=S8FHQ1_FOMSC|nr:hypothetical protein FOMPIDRAFT_1052000 [Fomitopsis schrenkii]
MHSTEPLKALPFSLRPSALSNSNTPTSLQPTTFKPVAPAPTTLLIDLTTIPPVTEATAPAASDSASPSFHDLLANLPPAAYIPLEVVPRRPDETRKPFRLNLKLGGASMSWESEFAKPVQVVPPRPHRHVHRIHTESTFSPQYYEHMQAAKPSHRAGTALTLAELHTNHEPGQSHRSTPAYPSVPLYHPEERVHGAMGYLADMETLSNSGDSDELDDDSLFDPEEAEECSPATETSHQVGAVAVMAGGAGAVLPSEYKATITVVFLSIAFSTDTSSAGSWRTYPFKPHGAASVV